jgi:archaellum component FlaC
MMNCRNEARAEREQVEDALALVVGVEDHLSVIRVQAWRGGDQAQIFEEATEGRDELRRLKGKLVESWLAWEYVARCVNALRGSANRAELEAKLEELRAGLEKLKEACDEVA